MARGGPVINCVLASRLLESLADGRPHSLSSLAKAHDASESNVLKCLEALVVAGAGLLKTSVGDWQLPINIEWLDPQAIEAELTTSEVKPLLSVVGCVQSTNDTVRDNPIPSDGEAQVLLAEMQVQGRGRQGRGWQAGFAKNIILSVRSVVHVSPRYLSRLPILSGIALARSLRACGAEECGVKWPNDLVVFNSDTGIRKLAGILVESKPLAKESYDVVIGVGLNVDTSAADIDQPWIDLKEMMDAGVGLQRNDLAARCINALTEMLVNFNADSGDALLAQWSKYDVLQGIPITVKQTGGSGNDLVSVHAVGIGAGGELLVETPDGRQALHVGDVSVRLP